MHLSQREHKIYMKKGRKDTIVTYEKEFKYPGWEIYRNYTLCTDYR